MAERVRFSEFWFLYGQAIRQMGRLLLWLPLLIYGFLAFIVAWWHFSPFSPVGGPLLDLWIKLVRTDLAEAYHHYPIQFQLFPFYMGYARALLALIVEALAFGIFIDLILAIYHKRAPVWNQSFRQALRRYFKLALVWGVLIVVIFLISVYFYDFIEKVLGINLALSPRRQLAASVALRVLTILLYVPFAFALPAIMSSADSLGRSIGRGLAMFARHPIVAFGLVLIPYLIGFVPNWAASQAEAIVKGFSPPLVFYLAVLAIIVDVFINFIFLATTVKFYMDHSDE